MKKLHISWIVAALSSIVVITAAISPLLNPAPPPKDLNRIVTVAGTVGEDTTQDPDGDVQFKLKTDREVYWISLGGLTEISREDKVVVTGKLSEGFGGVTGAIYNAELINHSPTQNPLVKFRQRFSGAVTRAIGNPQASLGLGFLIGQKRGIPEDMENNLKALGLTHIIVASGYNLTILVSLARRLFSKISKYLALYFGFVMIAGFTLITGFSPSMSRAGLVAGLSLLAWYYGRKIHPFVLLPMAAGITVLINPSYAQGDIGWLLSFSAFAGILILSPLVQRYFWGSRKPTMLRQLVVDTLSAQAATMPIILFTFGQFAPLALPANLLVLPLIPISMLLTAIAGVTGLLHPAFGSILALPAKALLTFITTSAAYLANLPGAQGEFSLTSHSLIAMIVALLIATTYLWRRTKLNFLAMSSD